MPPTVFTDVPPDSKPAREEIFGPILSVFHADSFDDALDIAMDSEFALTGGVFSRNPRHVDMARRRFRVGNLYINRKITGAVVGRQPFGGLAMSGIGEKAGGPTTSASSWTLAQSARIRRGGVCAGRLRPPRYPSLTNPRIISS